jgi:hypothetical protein
MRWCSRSFVGIGLTISAAVVPWRDVGAQGSSRGQPRTAFAVTDLAKLRWLEGSWAGTAPDARDVYEHIHFVNDTTAEIAYFADSAFEHETGRGRLYLSVGRIYHTMGPNRWGATNVDARGVYFVPQDNNQSSVMWSRQSNDEWTATLRAGFIGRDRETIYHMRRVNR